MPKCLFCKNDINANNAYIVKGLNRNQYYCNKAHYESKINKEIYKPPKEKDGKPNDRRLLTDYIQQIYMDNGYDKHDINWQMIMKQIQNMQKDNPKLTYNWIRYILWYLIDIKQINLFREQFEGSIVNLVPYSYIDAYNYWKDMKELKNEFNNFDFSDNMVTIKKQNRRNKSKYKNIDF